ncbi:MAG: iron-sulfur cluster assembly scaffold protein [Candidatus Micrarchaeota archaeon]
MAEVGAEAVSGAIGVSDVDGVAASQPWLYSDVVKEHFFKPRNFVRSREEALELDKRASGVGTAGSPACGDLMKLWIVVKDGRIAECKWQTFGCASAIASTSVFSTMLTEHGGMLVEAALRVSPRDIVARLGGLPAIKFHCSVLADQAFKAAIANWRSRGGA